MSAALGFIFRRENADFNDGSNTRRNTAANKVQNNKNAFHSLWRIRFLRTGLFLPFIDPPQAPLSSRWRTRNRVRSLCLLVERTCKTETLEIRKCQ